jgi:hypothetical protein
MDEQVQEAGQPAPMVEDDHPALAAPEEPLAARRAEKAQIAREARALSLRLRKGKRLVFKQPPLPGCACTTTFWARPGLRERVLSLRSTGKSGVAKPPY